MRGHDSDIIGTAPAPRDPVAGLPMFETPAGPTPTLDAVVTLRPKARMMMEGPGQRAKREAREKVEPHLRGLRGKVFRVIHAHGPITRSRIAETAAIKVNTVNGRVAELIALKKVVVVGIDHTTGEGQLEIVGASTNG